MDNCNNIVNIYNIYRKDEKDIINSSNNSVLYFNDELNKKLTDEYYIKNKMVTFKEKYDNNGNLLSVTTYIRSYPKSDFNEYNNSNFFVKNISEIYNKISNYFKI
jgi:hypothetical protein